MTDAKKRKFISIVVSIIFFLLIQNTYYEMTALSNGVEIVGTDTFMRLVRVTEFHETKDWYDSIIDRNNAPYGDNLHWTRPFDILIYAVVLLLMPFLGYTKALHITGIIISVVLGCLSFPVLTWMSETVLNEKNQRILYLLFLTQLGLLLTFSFGRPDHHSLLAIIFIALIGGILRVLEKKTKKINLEITGLFLAISIWISVESIVLVIMALMTLSILWIFYEEEYDIKSFLLAKALTIYSFVILIIERPIKDILLVEYDKISMVYITFFILITCVYYVVNKIYSRSKARKYEFLKKVNLKLFRLILLLTVGLVGAGILIGIYPSFIKGPFAEVNPEIVPIWLSRVNEVQPMLSTNYQDIGTAIIHLGLPVVSILFLLICLKKNKIICRKHIIFFLTGLLVYLPLSLYQIRWISYLITLSLIPGVLLLDLTTNWLSKTNNKLLGPLLRAVVTIVFIFAFTIIGFVVMEKGDIRSDSKTEKPNLKELCDWINENEYFLGNEKTILGFMDFGPEILYWTDHRVIAGPYHRNDEGILFNYNTMTSSDEAYIIRNLLEREVDWILIAPNSKEKLIYSIKEGGDSFYNRLINNELPNWLSEIELPVELNNFILYKVDL